MKLRVAAAVVIGAAVAAAAGSAAPAAEITMPAKVYVPHELDVLTGATVTWQNTDRGTHTVTEDDDAFDSGHIRPGGTFSATFPKSGTFPFHCTIHRFMRGTVSVFDVVLRGPGEVLLAGRRARLEGVAPAGVAEVVLERVVPGPAEIVGRATPNADGAFAFVVRGPEPRRYRVRAGSATSPLVPVRVAPRVSANRTSGGMAVRAVPARPGARVALQEYERELFTFVTVARGRLDASSRAAIDYSPSEREHVRVVVLGTGGWSDGASRVILVRPR